MIVFWKLTPHRLIYVTEQPYSIVKNETASDFSGLAANPGIQGGLNTKIRTLNSGATLLKADSTLYPAHFWGTDL